MRFLLAATSFASRASVELLSVFRGFNPIATLILQVQMKLQ